MASMPTRGMLPLCKLSHWAVGAASPPSPVLERWCTARRHGHLPLRRGDGLGWRRGPAASEACRLQLGWHGCRICWTAAVVPGGDAAPRTVSPQHRLRCGWCIIMAAGFGGATRLLHATHNKGGQSLKAKKGAWTNTGAARPRRR